MKTELGIDTKINEPTMKIEEKFPEPSKYIDEVPATITDEIAPETNTTVFDSYHESLNSLLKKYTINHHKKTKNKHNDSN